MSSNIAYLARTRSDAQHFNTLVLPKVRVAVVNEIGLTLPNTQVVVHRDNQPDVTLTTDSEGIIFPNLMEDEEFSITLSDVHELEPEDSSTTDSGQHFAVNGIGPADSAQT